MYLHFVNKMAELRHCGSTLIISNAVEMEKSQKKKKGWVMRYHFAVST